MPDLLKTETRVLLKKGCGARLVYPVWDELQILSFRPLPVIDNLDELENRPTVKQSEADWSELSEVFHPHIKMFNVLTLFSKAYNSDKPIPKLSFIVSDVLSEDYYFDVEESPALQLLRYYKAACNERRVSTVGLPSGAVRIQYMWLIQGLTYSHKKTVISNPVKSQKHIHVYSLYQSAGKAVLWELNQLEDTDTALHPDKGVIVHVAKEGALIKRRPKDGIQEYEAVIKDNINGKPPKVSIDDIKRYTKPWEEILYVPSPEEQIKLMCNCGFSSLLLYEALGDSWDLPEYIKASAKQEEKSKMEQLNKPVSEGIKRPDLNRVENVRTFEDSTFVPPKTSNVEAINEEEDIQSQFTDLLSSLSKKHQNTE